ncbi:MAG: hypothetical protein DA330_02725 [Nitrososphaera sp.]|nr:hypothetical protein [Nitrososphaera sp.]
MGIFLPADITARITRFLAGQVEFPYIKKGEIIGAFYIFGKDYGVSGDNEIKEVRDLAKRTVEQAAKDIRMYAATPNRLNSAFTRENYTKRSLQIIVDNAALDQAEVNRRVAGDPSILSDCFAQHVAHFKQEYYFEIFGPFRKEQLPSRLYGKLEARMLLLGFNSKSLPFASSLEPFFNWMSSKV